MGSKVYLPAGASHDLVLHFKIRQAREGGGKIHASWLLCHRGEKIIFECKVHGTFLRARCAKPGSEALICRASLGKK